MSGPEAAKQMRMIGFDGPIIGITGDVDTRAYLAAGADIVLVKPVQSDDVLKAIATATAQRKAAAAAAAAAETAAAEARRARLQPSVQAVGSSLPLVRTASVEARHAGTTSASVHHVPSFSQSVKRAAREAAAFMTAGGGSGNRGSGDAGDGDGGNWRTRFNSVRIYPGAVSNARTALDAHRASRREGLMPSELFKVAPSALPVIPTVDRGVLMDEALAVHWEDLVTYTLQFKRQEHRTEKV